MEKIPQKPIAGIAGYVAIKREVIAQMGTQCERSRQRIGSAKPEIDVVSTIVTIGHVALIDSEDNGWCEFQVIG